MPPSLYDDLDDVAKKPMVSDSSKPAPNVGLRVTGNWSDDHATKSFNSDLKMMQAQLAARKAAQMTKNAQTTVLPSTAVLTSSSSAEGSYRFNQRTGKMEKITVANTAACVIGGVFGELSIPFAGVENEYNPLTPNDYEKMVATRREETQSTLVSNIFDFIAKNTPEKSDLS
ncbi:hypothetical protein Ciccas_003287 [Cichlidogyrus casuarinus]|uniref:Uncharacterized protein n=1 Tax=Cichlidogyrus casuarinus TaxID=1844966 RepID=A0ABD2QES2_9PLAT